MRPASAFHISFDFGLRLCFAHHKGVFIPNVNRDVWAMLALKKVGWKIMFHCACLEVIAFLLSSKRFGTFLKLMDLQVTF